MSEQLDLTGKTILIVEDEPNNRELLEILLEETHAKILSTAYGLEAFEIVAEQQIDLILMDIRLPDSNGLEITAEIRKTHPNLPIIAQTAFALSGDKQKALDAGCDAYISKPVKRNDLMEIIDALFIE